MGEISVPENQGPEDVGEVDAIAANENDEKQGLDEEHGDEEPSDREHGDGEPDEDRDPTLQRDRDDERLSPGQDTGGTGGAGAVMPPPD